jgi:hypothetical protein
VKEMADGAYDLHQWTYHLQGSDNHALTQQVDELAISNMLAVVNNPVLREMLSTEEMAMVLDTIKKHVVVKAKIIGDIQREKIDSLNRGKTFK